MTQLRVLHCPADVGGHPSALARAERELGLRSRAITFERSRFGYEIDEVLWRDGDGLLRREALRFQLFWRALREFDVIHFNFGHPISPVHLHPLQQAEPRSASARRLASNAYVAALGLRDLPLLKAAGKTIVVTYQGDDARQGDWLRANFELSPLAAVEPYYYAPDSDRRKRAAIASFDRYADRIYALNPDLLHVLPKRAQFLPYAHVDPRAWTPAAPAGSADRPLVIAHAPTHRGAKGTEFILQACQDLQHDGIAFELDLIEGVSQTEAQARFARADIAIDQLLAGWYGGVAVEAMALARPTIAYLRHGDLTCLPLQMRAQLPLIEATPATILEVLRLWLTERRHELSALGSRSRRFVEDWHDPLRIAGRLKNDYEQLRRRG